MWAVIHKLKLIYGLNVINYIYLFTSILVDKVNFLNVRIV